MKKKGIELTDPARQDAIEEIQQYFSKERDEDLSNFNAGLILDFILDKLGPHIYNQAINDAHVYMNERVEDLLGLEKRAR